MAEPPPRPADQPRPYAPRAPISRYTDEHGRAVTVYAPGYAEGAVPARSAGAAGLDGDDDDPLTGG